MIIIGKVACFIGILLKNFHLLSRRYFCKMSIQGIQNSCCSEQNRNELCEELCTRLPLLKTDKMEKLRPKYANL